MTMQNPKPWQILIEDPQFDEQDLDEQGNPRQIGSRTQYTTSYGLDEQDALNRYNEMYPSASPSRKISVVGVDPSFEEMMRTNTSSPNNPYFSNYNYANQYYGQQNPYAMPFLANTGNIDVNRQRGNPTPFSAELGQQPTFANMMQGMNRLAPPPSTARSVNADLAGFQLPTSYDAQIPFQPQQYQGGQNVVQGDTSYMDPYKLVSSQPNMDPRSWMPLGQGIDDMFPMFGPPAGGGADWGIEQDYSEEDIANLQERDRQNRAANPGRDKAGYYDTMTYEQQEQYDNELREARDKLGSLVQLNPWRTGLNWVGEGLSRAGRGQPTFQQDYLLQELSKVGITPEQYYSDDIDLLNQLIENKGSDLSMAGAQINPVTGQPDYRDRVMAEERYSELTRDEQEIETAATEDQSLVSQTQRQITPGMFNEAMQAIKTIQGGGQAVLPKNIVEAGMSDATGNSMPAVLLRQFYDAQARTSPFEQAQLERLEGMDQATKIDIPVAEIQGRLDQIGMEQESANYRSQIGFASDQMQMASSERINNSQLRSSEMIAQATNQSREYVAEVSANASRDVAQINGLSSQQVALINTRSAAEVAEITGMTQRDVERIKGEIQENIAVATNSSKEFIARLQSEAQLEVAQTQKESAYQVSTINNMSAEKIAGASNLTQLDVIEMQTEAQTTIANANNTSAETIAMLIYSDDATALRASELTDLKDIEKIRNDYNVALAQLTGTDAQLVAGINTGSAQTLQTAQIEYEKAKYEYEIAEAAKAEVLLATERQTIRTEQAQAATTARTQALADAATLRTQQLADIQAQYERSDQLLTAQQDREDDLREAEETYQASLRTAEQTYQNLVREDIQTFEGQQATGAQGAQMDLETLRVLGGYANPQELQAAQLELQRGGLSEEENSNLQALLARGGLTAQERLAEIQSETRSSEMNSLLALLSNPQALGAFVTILSGEMPFESVPTMGQLTDMTPGRLEYLQGALSALGIDPQTFIRMAQDVTPQAFQETGPFGQLSAMIA